MRALRNVNAIILSESNGWLIVAVNASERDAIISQLPNAYAMTADTIKVKRNPEPVASVQSTLEAVAANPVAVAFREHCWSQTLQTRYL